MNVISTNAVPVIHAAALQLGWNLSTGQIEAAGTAVALFTRYAHLEGPRIKAGIVVLGNAAYKAGVWIDSRGGLRTIANRLIGPKAVAAPLAINKGTQSGTGGVAAVPLNSSMGI